MGHKSRRKGKDRSCCASLRLLLLKLLGVVCAVS
jgi:hypothetical protein